MEELRERLKSSIRAVPDFPKPGILFYDVSTLFRDAEAFRLAVDALEDYYSGHSFDAIAGIEARGFLLASVLADRMRQGIVMLRKPGKLPAETLQEEYTLEYGTNTIEVHADAVQRGQRVLVLDDLLATGGTAAAAGRLVERLGGKVGGYGFLVELSFLPGRSQLPDADVFSLLQYDE